MSEAKLLHFLPDIKALLAFTSSIIHPIGYHSQLQQPVPNPFSKYFHFMPKPWHKVEVWTNHFVEIIAPFMLFSPFRKWRIAGGLIQIIFQLVLISSGNLRYVLHYLSCSNRLLFFFVMVDFWFSSFLNWLTIVSIKNCLFFKNTFFLYMLPTCDQ